MRPKTNTRLVVLCIGCVFIVPILIKVLIGSNSPFSPVHKEPASPIPDRRNVLPPPPTVPKDEEYKGLMRYSASPLALATMNLRAAKGLPGSEDLDIEKCIATLNEWAEHIKNVTETQMLKFYANPADFNNSEAYFKMLVMQTVLSEDFKVKYKPEFASASPEDVDLKDISYAKDSKNLFLHGILTGKREGTCASLPVLVATLGRMLGYPLKLVPAKTHLFVRWDDGNEKFNIDATSPGLVVHPDEYYRHWPYQISNEEMAQGYYLAPFSDEQEIAVSMGNLAMCLMANERYLDALIQFRQIERLDPKRPYTSDIVKSLQNFLSKELKTP